MYYRNYLLNSNLDTDTDTLQTDILRFLSIIGFCLMAIFALVQAIPVTVNNQDLVIENMKTIILEQRQKLEDLNKQNKELVTQVKHLFNNQLVFNQYKKELNIIKFKLQDQQDTIDKLTKDKIEVDKNLVAYKNLLNKRNTVITSLIKDKEDIEKEIKQIKEYVSPKQVFKIEPVPIEKRKLIKKGLTVVFESDQVFLDLLSSRDIYFLITISGMNRGFYAVRKDMHIGFETEVKLPTLDFWEIKENMVPIEVLEAFKKWTTLASSKKLLFVGLSPEISEQIRNKNVDAGKFVIKENGLVYYSN